MRRHTKLFTKVLIAALLTLVLSAAGNSYSAHAQGAIAQPPKGDPTGATTGTAKDVTVKDAKNPTLPEVMETVGHNKIAINFVWTLLAGFLVMFMQAGFAMVETGFTPRQERGAHHVHELHDLPDRHARLLDLRLRAADGRRRRRRARSAARRRSTRVHDQRCSATPSACSAMKGFFLSGDTYDVGVFALFLFQMVFMDTAGTIPTGAMAERWKFSAFVVFGFFMSMVVYPLYRQLGLGRRLAVATLGQELRPRPRARRLRRIVGGAHGRRRRRAGRRDRHRSAHRQVHQGRRVGRRCPATTCRWRLPARSSSRSAGSASTRARRWRAATCASPSWRPTRCWPAPAARLRRCSTCGSGSASPIPSMLVNGMLAGLVAITAPCAFVNSVSAVIIGVVAGHPRRRVGALHRARAEDRRSGRRDFRARRLRRVRRAVASGSSPTAPTATAGTACRAP